MGVVTFSAVSVTIMADILFVDEAGAYLMKVISITRRAY
jgi:hypothetical protein